MKLDREIKEQYQKAYAFATRDEQKDKKLGLPTGPVVLEEILDESMISDKLDMGILDVPTNMIAGSAHRTESNALYTKALLPLSSPNSSYAELWRELYAVLANDESFRDAIKCVEYLGKFYVIDGMKRASVAKFFDVPTVKSWVIRVMPIENGSVEVAQYYDFLFDYQLTHLYQLQFTQKGYLSQLQNGLQRQKTYVWNESDRLNFLHYWPKIESAFRKSYGDCLKITAADALVVLMKRYTYSQIIHMDPWVLARVFQAAGRELYALSFPELAQKETFKTGRLYTA